VIGFTGLAIMAKYVASPLQQFAREVFINGEDPWKATVMCFGGYGRTRVLLHTPVCLIFRDKKTNTTEARVLRYSHPRSLPWGVNFTTCPSGNDCAIIAGDLRWTGENEDKRHDFIKVDCARCGHSSGWLKRPDWIHPFDGKYLSHTFWTDHPLTTSQRESMSSMMASEHSSMSGGGRGGGHLGVESRGGGRFGMESRGGGRFGIESRGGGHFGMESRGGGRAGMESRGGGRAGMESRGGAFPRMG
jgi:hypothetical protein